MPIRDRHNPQPVNLAKRHRQGVILTGNFAPSGDRHAAGAARLPAHSPSGEYPISPARTLSRDPLLVRAWLAWARQPKRERVAFGVVFWLAWALVIVSVFPA